ncbi:hypothetical protein VNI00_003571 [Paramarasmius palmivorus]|uniref:Uncharacterized protein n=1 Tax=Paramarasmius palmivorus TaxID=297713 RepID=A0AAW0DPR6_9AGAR
MAQPNIQNVNNAFAGAGLTALSNEVALVPNIPVVNNPQQLAVIQAQIQQVLQVQQAQQALLALIPQMAADIGAINTFVQNAPMRRFNTAAGNIGPLQGPGSVMIPNNFPYTREHIDCANGNDLDELNDHLGRLPNYVNNALVSVRRQVLANFLGIVVQ